MKVRHPCRKSNAIFVHVYDEETADHEDYRREAVLRGITPLFSFLRNSAEISRVVKELCVARDLREKSS